MKIALLFAGVFLFGSAFANESRPTSLNLIQNALNELQSGESFGVARAIRILQAVEQNFRTDSGPRSTRFRKTFNRDANVLIHWDCSDVAPNLAAENARTACMEEGFKNCEIQSKQLLSNNLQYDNDVNSWYRCQGTASVLGSN